MTGPKFVVVTPIGAPRPVAVNPALEVRFVKRADAYAPKGAAYVATLSGGDHWTLDERDGVRLLTAIGVAPDALDP